MKAVAYLLANNDEIVAAQKMNLKVPAPETVEREVLFPIGTILFSFQVDDTKIKCITSFGQELMLKNVPEVWSRIKAHLEHI
jgi:hypothetical protein